MQLTRGERVNNLFKWSSENFYATRTCDDGHQPKYFSRDRYTLVTKPIFVECITKQNLVASNNLESSLCAKKTNLTLTGTILKAKTIYRWRQDLSGARKNKWTAEVPPWIKRTAITKRIPALQNRVRQKTTKSIFINPSNAMYLLFYNVEVITCLVTSSIAFSLI